MLAVPAAAHVSIENAETKPGGFKARFNVPHGCDGSATTAVKITIPEGIIGVKPMPKASWQLSLERGAYAKTYDHHHGRKVSEGVKAVTWSGGNLPNDYLDEFVLGLYVTDAFAPGSTVYFPVEQTCEKGNLEWADIPADGQDAHDLKAPAPGLRIVADQSSSSTQAPAIVKAGDLTIQAPWLRPTPGGATVGAGYLTITNTGAAADRLISVASPAAARVEVHEMKTTDGVMKMRALPNGIEIAPGTAVTLAPSGTHLMLMDLKAPLTAGGQVPVTLTFEKAGAVTATFPVKAIGDAAPADSHQHPHH